jgi:septum formation topological specificity factor MinE
MNLCDFFRERKKENHRVHRQRASIVAHERASVASRITAGTAARAIAVIRNTSISTRPSPRRAGKPRQLLVL